MIKARLLIYIYILISLVFCQDQGILNYQNQNYKDAEKYYDSILSNDNDNSEAHFGKGASLFMQEDLKNAEVKFNESLATQEEMLKSKAFYNLGNISYKNNKLDEALQFYKKALELNPYDDEARYNYEFIRYQKKPEEENKDQENEEEEKEDKKEEEQKEEEEKEDKKEEEQKEEEEKEDKNSEKNKDDDEDNKEKNEDEKKDEEKKDESQSQREAQGEKKSQDLKKAESILDALKNDEKVMQKQQLQRFKTKKLLKDW